LLEAVNKIEEKIKEEILCQKTGATMRFTIKIFLSTIAFISILLALGTYTMNSKLGSAEATSATVSDLLKNDEVALAAGTFFVNHLLKDVSPQLIGQMTVPRSVLNKAAAKGIQKSSGSVSVAAGKAYDALINNKSARVNLRALIVTTGTTLHSIDRHIPTTVGLGNAGYIVITADNSTSHQALVKALSTMKRLMNMWWLFLLIALGLFVGISVVDKRSGVGAWRWPGYILFVTGGAWLFIASLLPKLASEKISVDKQDVFNTAAGALNGGLMAAAVGATLLGGVLIVLSFVMKS
jgi:hypothetical protein